MAFSGGIFRPSLSVYIQSCEKLFKGFKLVKIEVIALQDRDVIQFLTVEVRILFRKVICFLGKDIRKCQLVLIKVILRY